MNEATEQIEVEPVEAVNALSETSPDDATPSSDAAPAESEASSPANEVRETGERLVSVSEAIRYRKRAQAAERELAETRARLEEATREAQAAQQRLAQVERRAAIEAGLVESGATDLEAARLLVESALNEGEADVAAAIENVRRRRPQMFRTNHSAPRHTAAMGPAVQPAVQGERDLDRAAIAARRSGHNADVMHYMNLRRSAPR
ncbi:MAG: hypothetical protein KJZ69_09815 [Phycisphaerales bacterium]|nr:hypothetical protein [Phycisphaerales bacterium]